MVLTKTPLLALQIRDARRWGTRIPLGRCGDDGGREMNPIGRSRTRLSSSPLDAAALQVSGNTGTSRLTRCFSKLPLCYESRNPSVLALANPDPLPSPSHILSPSLVLPQQLETARTGSVNQLREAGHRHTVESGTATREVWSLSPTGFYSRSSQPAEFYCGLSQTDISHLSCE
jgi:hypothetical protein